MAAGEELFFRGIVQAEVGLVAAVAIYAGAQLVTGVWALAVAAIYGGLMWGSLMSWRHGLLAALVAHVIWTVALTLVWPLPREQHDAERRAAA
jgi:membrane protease YdiL (CAAX protease family)